MGTSLAEHFPVNPGTEVYSLLVARTAPATAPLVIVFQGSSLPRIFTIPQSIMENRAPHAAKLPEIRQDQKYDFTANINA